MTLLVGVLCKDGAVIAADRQVSAANLGMPARKISILGSRSVSAFAASGDVALGQRIQAVVSKQVDRVVSQNYADIVPEMSNQIVHEAMLPFYKMHQALQIPLDNYPACDCLFLSRFRDESHLAHINCHGNFTKLDDFSRFCCLGSGTQHGLSFLTFIWSVFFSETPPSLSEGVLVAYWTVQVAIDLQATYVGLGTDVCILPDDKEAKILSPEELKENDDLIGEMRKAMLFVKNRMGGAIAPRDIPPPPILPPKGQGKA